MKRLNKLGKGKDCPRSMGGRNINKIKRYMGVCLSAFMLSTSMAMPVTSFAATVVDSYIIDSSTGTITGYNNESNVSEASLSVPSSVKGVTVKAIGDGALERHDKIESLTISDGVTDIGAFAFAGCKNMKTVSIPNSIKSIGEYAFEECDSLTDVYFKGTKSEWDKISIGGYNTALTSANIHYENEEDTHTEDAHNQAHEDSSSKSSSTLLGEKSPSAAIASGSNIASYQVESLTVAVKYDLYEEKLIVKDTKGDIVPDLKFEFRTGERKLPDNLTLSSDGLISGIPMNSGDFNLSVHIFNEDKSVNIDANIPLKIMANSDENVLSYTDEGYYLTDLVSDLDFDADGWSVMKSEGAISEYVDLYLDGELLKKGNAPAKGEAPALADDEDYYAEEGSTKLTIKNQTLTKKGKSTHTLAMKFKDSSTGTLRRAAQNYTVKETSSKNDSNKNTNNNNTNNNTKTRSVSGGSSGGGSGSGSGSGGVRSNNNNNKPVLGRTGRAYTASPDTPGKWEHGTDGAWYFRKENGDLWTGWIVSDHHWYCLDDKGRMYIGWQLINNRWYYFNNVSDGTLGECFSGWHDINGKWYYFHVGDDNYNGQMYSNTVTPDGHHVGLDGSRIS